MGQTPMERLNDKLLISSLKAKNKSLFEVGHSNKVLAEERGLKILELESELAVAVNTASYFKTLAFDLIEAE